MSIFDDTLNSVRDITDSVIEKTGKFMDVSRLKLTSAEISKEITRRYEALGRVVYDSTKAGTDIEGLISECVRSIDALYGRLDDVNARVAGLRDKKYCSTCGATVEKSAIYCNRCGSRVDEAAGSAANAAEQTAAAPEKTEDIMEDLMEKAEDIAEDITESAAETVENITAAVEDAAEDVIDKVESVLDEAEYGSAD